MESTRLYNCERGTVYLTGDSYGYDLCVCLGIFPGKYFPLVHFANVATGQIHTSGHAPGGEGYSDTSYRILRLEDNELKIFLEQWELTEYAK